MDKYFLISVFLSGKDQFVTIFSDISAQKKVEEDLRREKDFRESIIQNSPAFFVAINAKGKMLMMNNTMLNALGYSLKEIIGKDYLSIFVPKEDRVKFSNISQKIVKNNVPILNESQIIAKNGQKLLVEWHGSPVLKSNGDVDYFIGVGIDVTERKQAEEKIIFSEERYRNLFENAPVAMLTFDLTGRVTTCNNAWLKLSGYTKDEMVGKHFSQLNAMPIKDIPKYSKRLFALLTGRNVSPFIGTYYSKNGGKLYFHNHVLTIKEKDRKVGFQVISVDIKNLKTTGETLRQSQQEFASLFKNSPEALVYVDNKGNILDINNRFSELFGYTLKEIKGKNINEGIIHPPTRIKEGKELDKIAFTKGYTNFETVRKRKDGSLFPVLISGSPVIVNGQLLGIIGTFIDITERKIAEDKLEKSFKKLQKTMDTTIDTMSKIIEAKDPYTFGHQRRVSQLAIRIAQELDLPKDKIEGIRITSLIHDVGKIGLPTEILSKPTKLNDLEYSLIKNHSQIGYDIIKSIDFSYPVAQIVLQHHERLNGSGYPAGLKRHEILLEAKIICVADVVEAMSSHRPYRPALGIDKALEEIFKNKNLLYDPEVVDACIRLFKEKDFEFEL
ncbi:MAG: PAS domain S-box protein [Atribacterota bacterium]|nr:PAS domain S-box protein [Atribacterota bacterium]